MGPLQYHAGQVAIQDEANTRRLADNLAHWTGPVAEFALGADLLLLAVEDDGGVLRFTVISGPPPLVDIAGPSSLRVRPIDPELGIPPGCFGGLAINLAAARRVRINGAIDAGDDVFLRLEETFTLCRKYMAPSVSLGDEVRCGPGGRAALPTDDPGLLGVLAVAECSFLASVAPGGGPDVAHRGGPGGFLKVDPTTASLSWPEYLGDGVFKSAGNVRATGRCTVLVPDFATGAGYELVCSDATYTNVRTSRRERLDPLIQDGQPYPVQGLMRAQIDRVFRLEELTHPRHRIERSWKVTSRSEVDMQAPQ